QYHHLPPAHIEGSARLLLETQRPTSRLRRTRRAQLRACFRGVDWGCALACGRMLPLKRCVRHSTAPAALASFILRDMFETSTGNPASPLQIATCPPMNSL